MGRGRTTPDTLKVKTSHVMPHREGTGFLSARPLTPPPRKAFTLTSLPATPPRCWPPPPYPSAQVLAPILGTATIPGFIYVIS